MRSVVGIDSLVAATLLTTRSETATVYFFLPKLSNLFLKLINILDKSLKF